MELTSCYEEAFQQQSLEGLSGKPFHEEPFLNLRLEQSFTDKVTTI